ncbi:MAG: MOSC domain-containing protein [Gaiellaceae bacterium]
MYVAELWRYPVKSMRGERLDAATIRADGIVGDRIVHVRESSGRVATSRFRPGLLGLAATLGEDGEPRIDGVAWSEPSVLAHVRAVTESGAELVRFEGADHGQRFDVLPLTVLTESMARAVGYDHRRFRPNVLIGGARADAELEWPGFGLRIGEALIGVRNRRSRCVMTTFDPDTLEQDPMVLLHVVRSFNGRVALDCWVAEPGGVRVGDPVEVVELPAGLAA